MTDLLGSVGGVAEIRRDKLRARLRDVMPIETMSLSGELQFSRRHKPAVVFGPVKPWPERTRPRRGAVVGGSRLFAAEHSVAAFPTGDTRIWPNKSAGMPFLGFGYSTRAQLSDKQHIGTRSIEIQAIYEGGSASPHLQRVKMEKSFKGSPDVQNCTLSCLGQERGVNIA